MLEQLREEQEALPVVQTLRQHVGRKRFPDHGHRRAKTKKCNAADPARPG
jgi:hypothetical protein